MKKTASYYKYKKSYYEKRRFDKKNKGKIWTDDDIKLLFEYDGTDSELSDIIGRSVQAIQIKRSKEISREYITRNNLHTPMRVYSRTGTVQIGEDLSVQYDYQFLFQDVQAVQIGADLSVQYQDVQDIQDGEIQ
jgi:hypothetical protein